VICFSCVALANERLKEAGIDLAANQLRNPARTLGRTDAEL
jgi:hypothetical protein